MRCDQFRLLGTIGLVAVAFGIAKAGRLGLDWLASTYPEWAVVIEHLGGWLVGLVVVIVVLLPIFRLYGVFNRSDSETDA